MLQNRTEWIIYKNEQKIGQAITWHKGLDILVKQEGLSQVHLCINSNIITFVTQKESFSDQLNRYKIVKER